MGQPQCRTGQLQGRARTTTFPALQDTETDTQQSQAKEIIRRTLKAVEFREITPPPRHILKAQAKKLKLSPFRLRKEGICE